MESFHEEEEVDSYKRVQNLKENGWRSGHANPEHGTMASEQQKVASRCLYPVKQVIKPSFLGCPPHPGRKGTCLSSKTQRRPEESEQTGLLSSPSLLA